MPNTNCLAGMRCPKCKGKGPYRINASCFAVVHDDGVNETTDHEWSDDSTCLCLDCKNGGVVAQFRIENQRRRRKLKHKASEAVVAKLLELAGDKCLESEDLDEVVHDVASRSPSDINNGGLEDQIEYLVGALGAKDAKREIEKLAKRK